MLSARWRVWKVKWRMRGGLVIHTDCSDCAQRSCQSQGPYTPLRTALGEKQTPASSTAIFLIPPSLVLRNGSLVSRSLTSNYKSLLVPCPCLSWRWIACKLCQRRLPGHLCPPFTTDRMTGWRGTVASSSQVIRVLHSPQMAWWQRIRTVRALFCLSQCRPSQLPSLGAAALASGVRRVIRVLCSQRTAWWRGTW